MSMSHHAVYGYGGYIYMSGAHAARHGNEWPQCSMAGSMAGRMTANG